MFSARRLLIGFAASAALLSAALAQAVWQPGSLDVRTLAVTFATSSVDPDVPVLDPKSVWPRPPADRLR